MKKKKKNFKRQDSLKGAKEMKRMNSKTQLE